MKRAIIRLMMILLPSCLMMSCTNDDLLDEVPQKIATFLTQYYPGVGVKNYTRTSDTYHVRLSNGPAFTFDSDYNWISVNGYGETLPQVMLFDCLPPALYNYLEAGENTDSVICMERTSLLYTVVLIDTTVYYRTDTGRITQGDSSSAD